MKLFLVHCGFYDLEFCDGIYEWHSSHFVVAKDFEEAKAKVRLEPEFKKRKMHVDGLQEISQVNGCQIAVIEGTPTTGQTLIHSNPHRDL